MADSYVLGWILCSVMALVALCGVVLRRQKWKGISMRTEPLKTVLTSNGECGSADASHADVIIVGAGVAGSALAHTLGKVFLSFSLHFLSNQSGNKQNISLFRYFFYFFRF